MLGNLGLCQALSFSFLAQQSTQFGRGLDALCIRVDPIHVIHFS